MTDMGRHLPSRGFELFCVAVIAAGAYFVTPFLFPGVTLFVPMWILALFAASVFVIGAFSGLNAILLSGPEKKEEKKRFLGQYFLVIAGASALLYFVAAMVGGMSHIAALSMAAMLVFVDLMFGPFLWRLPDLVLRRIERRSTDSIQHHK